MLEKYNEELINLRREFHQIPELGYHEFKTKEKIVKYLENLGITDIKVLGDTGVVAVIYGDGKKTIGVRADIDALKVYEETGLPYKSLHEGCMHACGHDGHIAMNLILAKYFTEHKEELKGNLKLIFQPAEEGGLGAVMMIENGALKSPETDCIISGHLWPDIDTGKIDISYGTTFAADSHIEIEINGKGGHGAYPEYVKDSIHAGSKIVVALKELSKNFNDNGVKNVLSICSFDCVSSHNVYKDNAYLRGTLRTLESETEKEVSEKIKETVEKIFKECDIDGKCTVTHKYIPLVNNDEVTKSMKEAVAEAIGKENVIELGSAMTSEDFGFFAKAIPACHMKIGTKSENIPYKLHQSKYTINEDSLIIGVKGFIAGIKKLLGE